jgi:hypothetical protein
MFRIEFFVDDKKLAQALHGLLGIALGDPKITPVINAEAKKNGRIRQLTSGKLPDQFMHYLTSSKFDIVRPKDAIGWLTKHGFSKLSSSYMLKQCVNMGFLRKTGKSSGTVYHIIRALPKPTKKG